MISFQAITSYQFFLSMYKICSTDPVVVSCGEKLLCIRKSTSSLVIAEEGSMSLEVFSEIQ